jgi:hypothetical protein
MKFDPPAQLMISFDRFELWTLTLDAKSRTATFEDQLIVPLDVLMVWHAYLLNPGYLFSTYMFIKVLSKLFHRWYHEDCWRLNVLAAFCKFKDEFFTAAVS